MEGVELVPSALTPSEAVESMPGAYCIYRNASDPASVTPRVLASKVGVGGLMTPQEENNLLKKLSEKGTGLHVSPVTYPQETMS